MIGSKRIVFSTFGSLGDLHPYLAIALELKAMGHLPVLATSAFYREKVEDLGLEFAAVRPDVTDFHDDQGKLMAEAMHPVKGPEFVIRKGMMPHLEATYTDLKCACQEADLLVSHPLTFPAPIVHQLTGIPWVSTVLAPVSLFSCTDPPLLGPVPWLARLHVMTPRAYRLMFEMGKRMFLPWVRPVQHLRQKLGLPPGTLHPLFEGQHSPSLVLALFSEALAAPQPDWPPATLQTGFCMLPASSEPPLDGSLEAFLAAGEAPLVFTLGSAAVMSPGQFFHESLRAAELVGMRAVFITGRDQKPPFPEGLPQWALAVEYASFSRLFSQAALIVHQAGIGTTGQVMLSGRPSLAVPFSHDQPDNARRLERIGAARVLSISHYRADRAAHGIASALESCKSAAAALPARIQTEGGAPLAARALIDILNMHG